jgi:predicted MFS family arabinose efflux permease
MIASQIQNFKNKMSSIIPRVVDTDPEMREVRHFLILVSMAVFMSFQIWRSVFNNFAVEDAGINAHNMGVIQSLREVPGFLALLVILVLKILTERTIALSSAFVMGLGIILTGFFPDFGGLIATTLIMSFGFHYFETINQSLALQHIPKDRSPLFFGQLRAWSGVAGIAGLAIAYGLSMYLSYKLLFVFAGSVIIFVVIWSASKYKSFKERIPQRREMVLRSRYWLYYTLTFLAGARRQIFVAFAVFLLVDMHHFTIQDITILFLANSVVSIVLSPAIGSLIQKFGERPIVILEYSGLILVFFGYTIMEEKWALSLLYILDHIFFNMSIAIKTYFQKIADPADMAPSTAVGFTINHIAAVVIPFIGGYVWMIDYRYTFYMGIGLAVCSLIFATFIDTSKMDISGAEVVKVS